jgi:hypothetical protein
MDSLAGTIYNHSFVWFLICKLCRFETSAKENLNVSEAGEFLVKEILKRDPKISLKEKTEGIVDLNAGPNKQEPQKQCAC